MSNTAYVVDGEASESDSEVELGKSPDSEFGATGFVIPGEAPESDDDYKLPNLVALKENDLPLKVAMEPGASLGKVYNSLLHEKLWECNVSLRATIEGLVRHTTDISVEKLAKTDKTLLNVQESMRSTNAHLTLARARLKQIHNELEKASCSTAFPTVKIKP